MKLNYCLCLLVMLALGAATMNAGEVVSAGGGKSLSWKKVTSWSTGVLPGPLDNVTIANGDTVTVDTNFVVSNITVGEGVSGVLQLNKTTSDTMTINGNLTVNTGGIFKVLTNTNNVNLLHLLTISGNITHSGVGFDCRQGTNGTTLSVLNMTFIGSANSVITMNTPFSTTNGEFNGWTIKKTGNAGIVLGSDVYISSGNSTNYPSNLIFVSGKIYTGSHALIHQSTTSATISGASDTTGYVVGTLGRGMSTSAGATKDFAIGDSNNYRPFRLRSTNAGGGTSGHTARVGVIVGNANTGTTVSGGVDKVSSIRYYKVSYYSGGVVGADTMRFDRFTPSYGLKDGIVAGSTNLQVALADSTLKAWIGNGPTLTTYTTALDTLPRLMNSDTTTGRTLRNGQFMFVALARKTGTTDNSLDAPSSSVARMNTLPGSFALSQNFPNPFNPSTEFSFSIPAAQMVSVKVFDVIGKEVATLVDGQLNAGAYRATWNAANAASGVYYYRIQTPGFVQTRKMLLMR